MSARSAKPGLSLFEDSARILTGKDLCPGKVQTESSRPRCGVALRAHATWPPLAGLESVRSLRRRTRRGLPFGVGIPAVSRPLRARSGASQNSNAA